MQEAARKAHEEKVAEALRQRDAEESEASESDDDEISKSSAGGSNSGAAQRWVHRSRGPGAGWPPHGARA